MYLNRLQATILAFNLNTPHYKIRRFSSPVGRDFTIS